MTGPSEKCPSMRKIAGPSEARSASLFPILIPLQPNVPIAPMVAVEPMRRGSCEGMFQYLREATGPLCVKNPQRG